VLAAIFWLALWSAAALYVSQELILPSPISVFRTLLYLCGRPEFWKAAALSLLRIFGGFAAGTVLTARFDLMDTLFSPLIRRVRTTPVASFIILALLWMGHALVPAFMAMLMVTPIVWESLRAAILAVDPELLEMAFIYRFGAVKTIKLVYIPSVLSPYAASLATAVGLAWKSGIAAEVLCLPRLAIGTNLYYSKIYLETPSLFAWTIVVIVLSFMLEGLFSRLLRKRRKKRW
jgi:NitT/TauT family transport system permease protein